MITEDALFDVIDQAVTDADESSPIHGATVYSTTRGSVADTVKTIRVQVFNGSLMPPGERRENQVEFVVQNLSKALATGTAAEQAAQGSADAMLFTIFDLLRNNPRLNGAVCDINFYDREKNFDRLVIDINAKKYGSAYLYGTINP